MNPEATAPARPAWREPLVWMIVGIPATTVVAGIFTWWIAAQRADSNVADDYYKRGLAINRSLERDARAQALGLRAEVELRDGNDLHVRITGGMASPPATLTVALTHPVRAERDRRLTLDRQADGSYRIRSPLVGAGRWDLSIEAQDWRLAARRVDLNEQATVRLSADGRVL